MASGGGDHRTPRRNRRTPGRSHRPEVDPHSPNAVQISRVRGVAASSPRRHHHRHCGRRGDGKADSLAMVQDPVKSRRAVRWRRPVPGGVCVPAGGRGRPSDTRRAGAKAAARDPRRTLVFAIEQFERGFLDSFQVSRKVGAIDSTVPMKMTLELPPRGRGRRWRRTCTRRCRRGEQKCRQQAHALW